MENKKDVASGSATIMVMMVMTILIIIGTTALHTATMLYDLAMQRIKICKRQRSSQALTHYGIACCKVIDDFKKKEKEYTYTLDEWPDHTSEYNGRIIIAPQKKQYEVRTQLFKGMQLVAQTSCVVIKDQSSWKIANFTV